MPTALWSRFEPILFQNVGDRATSDLMPQIAQRTPAPYRSTIGLVESTQHRRKNDRPKFNSLAVVERSLGKNPSVTERTYCSQSLPRLRLPSVCTHCHVVPPSNVVFMYQSAGSVDGNSHRLGSPVILGLTMEETELDGATTL
jgi:hypothetical protein